MREILFRGKRSDNGEWIEGYVYRISEKLNPFIMLKNRHSESYQVILETVCQYTGCNDKSKTTKVFEGDIVWDEFNEEYGVVEFDEGEFAVNFYGDIGADRFADVIDCCYVCGNIHDNPELLTNENNG